MATKLDWKDNSSSHGPGYIAHYKGLRIRAEHDDSPENPFEEHDSHWPMSVYSSGSLTDYDKTFSLNNPGLIGRFGDHALIHNQKHIAEALGFKSEGWCWDADELRGGFQDSASDLSPTKWLDAAAELCALLDIPCLVHESRGYSQGDWAKLLIVATPGAVKEFGTNFEEYRAQAKAEADGPVVQVLRAGGTQVDVDNVIWTRACRLMLELQAKLYDAWAWGDVYGYVVEQNIHPQRHYGHETWEEIPHGSCWGFYGSDFDWSGLEESAMEVVDAHVKEEVPA